MGLLGLSKLSIKWLKLGIVHEPITPGEPQQNGRPERTHRTLKRETATPPAFTSEEQEDRFDEFRRCFNRERPHEVSHLKRTILYTLRALGRTRSLCDKSLMETNSKSVPGEKKEMLNSKAPIFLSASCHATNR